MLRLQGAKRLTRSFRNLQIARDPEQPSVAIWGLEKTNVDSNYLKVLSHAIKNAKTDESIKAIVIRNEDPDTERLGLWKEKLPEILSGKTMFDIFHIKNYTI